MKLWPMPILPVYDDSQIVVRNRMCSWVDYEGSESWSGFVVWKWRVRR